MYPLPKFRQLFTSATFTSGEKAQSLIKARVQDSKLDLPVGP